MTRRKVQQVLGRDTRGREVLVTLLRDQVIIQVSGKTDRLNCAPGQLWNSWFPGNTFGILTAQGTVYLKKEGDQAWIMYVGIVPTHDPEVWVKLAFPELEAAVQVFKTV